MQLTQEKRDVRSAGVQEVARATIKTTPKIFNFFADQTYANKPRAICRELGANAWDSHKMAGKADTPFEVWLPTLLDPVFRVRDNGLGMSHEFMMTSFMCYADGSTKDGDDVAIGGFGIGSKAPFAYVDQYTVTSRYDGVERVYTVFKDEEGIPSIAFLVSTDTDEPNGVEVSFPVQPDDFDTFTQAALGTLKYFDPLPVLKNAGDGVELTPPTYKAKGSNWGMREDSGALHVIMGGVRYPVDAGNLNQHFSSEDGTRDLLQYGIDLRLPIGSCAVALSREALSYTDETVTALHTAVTAMADEVASSFATMFDHLTPWAAAKKLSEEIGEGYGGRSRFLTKHAKYRGNELKTSVTMPKLLGERYDYEQDKHVLTMCYPYSFWEIDEPTGYRRKTYGRPLTKCDWKTVDRKHGREIRPAVYSKIVFDDLPQKPGSKATKKIKIFAESIDAGKILVIRPDEDCKGNPAEFFDGLGNPPEDMIVFTSELPEPPVKRRAAPNRPRIRMFRYTGYGNPGYRCTPCRYSSDWQEIEYLQQPTEGIFVEMNNFEFSGIRPYFDSGLIDTREVRFVNSGDAKKLDKDAWTPIKEEFDDRLSDALDGNDDLGIGLALEASCLSHLFEFFRRFPDEDWSSPKSKPLARVFAIYNEFVANITPDQRRLRNFVDHTIPGRIKPAEILERLQQQQPNLNRILELTDYRPREEDIQLIKDNL